ncbi:MAG: Trm112 family protein [Candidatus Malihini olakiniferum]
MNHHLLEIIACPVCNEQLYYNKDKLELICKVDLLAYLVHHGIPVLLESEARKIPKDEITV